ncbi:MAG: 2'-5' RNA ligase family protein [Nocardioides sp.]|uniref:2'-5' RNA ligase family protein n=1 Tax=Nocardioides sp. TaxID=35761 RepID=UPI0039E3DAE6
MDLEAALIVPCPEAEAAVGEHRRRLDRAAAVGVPAHLTVLYPFMTDLDDTDHQRLATLFGSFEPFDVRGDRTGWFGDDVLFVAPADPGPVTALTGACQELFPECPIYGGAFTEVVPHLTVGHGQPLPALRAAERAVSSRLPFSQRVSHVELWTGPALATAPDGSWRCLRAYRLGKGYRGA